jgi:hypothetical protein
MQEATVGASRTQARSGKLALRGEANHISQFGPVPTLLHFRPR